MNETVELIEFIRKESGEFEKDINLSTQIENDLGITGDDAIDLIKKFSKKFKVDISDFDYTKYFYPEPNPYFSMANKISPLSVGDLYASMINGKLS